VLFLRQAFLTADVYDIAKQAGRLGEILTHHSPRFAPVVHSTLKTGVTAMSIAARAWLAA
jgi:hypothetical protein